MSRYRFVEAEKGRYPVTRLCRMAQVSRAAYYQWQDGRGSARQAAAAALLAAIRAIHAASGGQYGVPRVLAGVRAQSYDVGRKRVARLMAAAGLRAAGHIIHVINPRGLARYRERHAQAGGKSDPGGGSGGIQAGEPL
jgi:hypothetical protein